MPSVRKPPAKATLADVAPVVDNEIAPSTALIAPGAVSMTAWHSLGRDSSITAVRATLASRASGRAHQFETSGVSKKLHPYA